MALDNCPDCGREISATAKVCPHCGGKTRYARKTEDDKASSLLIGLLSTYDGCGRSSGWHVCIVFRLWLAINSGEKISHVDLIVLPNKYGI